MGGGGGGGGGYGGSSNDSGLVQETEDDIKDRAEADAMQYVKEEAADHDIEGGEADCKLEPIPIDIHLDADACVVGLGD